MFCLLSRGALRMSQVLNEEICTSKCEFLLTEPACKENPPTHPKLRESWRVPDCRLYSEAQLPISYYLIRYNSSHCPSSVSSPRSSSQAYPSRVQWTLRVHRTQQQAVSSGRTSQGHAIIRRGGPHTCISFPDTFRCDCPGARDSGYEWV